MKTTTSTSSRLLLDTLPGPWTTIVHDTHHYRGRYELDYDNLPVDGPEDKPVVIHIQHCGLFGWTSLGAPHLPYIPAIRHPSSETVRRHVQLLHTPAQRMHIEDLRFRYLLAGYFLCAAFLIAVFAKILFTL